MSHVVMSAVLTIALLAGCATHRPPSPSASQRPAADDTAGSIAANVAYAPGRALVCGGSAILAGVVMLVTFGQSYDSASELMHGGCSGPWVVSPEEIRHSIP